MTRFVTIIAAAVVLAGVGSASSSAGPLAGLRVVHVTDHNDQTGEKTVYTFTLASTDRLYVNRHEAEVVHADGTSEEQPLLHVGNITVSRVQK